MQIKSILCIFSGSDEELNAANAAFLIGKMNNAHIHFLHISPDPLAYVGLYADAMFAASNVISIMEKENQERAKKAKKHVAALAAKHQVMFDTPESAIGHASAKFIHQIGLQDDTIAREGRLSDLIIIGRQKTMEGAIISALFSTARPVLLMPEAKKDELSEWRNQTVALAWNASLEASRALYNAAPLIHNAENFHVLVAREKGKQFDETGLLNYLRMHGFYPDLVAADPLYLPSGKALLEKAEEIEADILVMGAYGHNRFREMILGGVTEYVLQHGNIPILLSH